MNPFVIARLIAKKEETRYNAVMTKSDAVNYWLTSAEHNSKTARDMFKMKHYDWSLFMWHLVIEKTIKGIISQQDKSPLAVHNLTKLAKQANLELSKEHKKYLIEITGFNLASRYDNYKFSFYKKATKSFSTVWIKNCEEVYQELLNICNKN